MAAALLLLAALLFRPCLWADDSKDQAPSFTPDSIVNNANLSPDSLAPNALATIYGQNLAFSTASVAIGKVASLPTRLAGVQVSVGGTVAPLLFVSAGQINFVVPSALVAGPANVVVERQGTSAQVRVTLLDTAPALFLLDGGKPAAEHADGSLISAESPAHPGEIIVVFATGLGRTSPRQMDGVIPRTAAPIVQMDRLGMLLDGHPLPARSIEYAGITPGYPGLYQINIRLPEVFEGAGPALQAVLGDQASQSSAPLDVSAGGP